MDNQNITIKILPAIREHITELSKNYREIEIKTVKKMGMDHETGILNAFDRSLFVKTAFIDNKIVAMWGCIGTYLGEIGYPWLIMSSEAEKYPFRIASFYKKELKEMLQLFSVLVDMVDIEHTQAIRLLKIMGFTFKEAQPFGKNGELFIRAEKRAL